ncbi:Lymphocyte function-associated antigen 3 [Labeo rohita]|uniref:Lymphocyte function-associated antigen 3 n=1 Tax=Labeo rohita TaxID=84645 RepID=A0ABQ8L204_LABRO|nr:Lymphocyte function-associated antigen 3 [Labeo rohita]
MTVYDDVLDGRFRDRLKLDNQTGSLTITNITTEHAGEYELISYPIRVTYILTVYALKLHAFGRFRDRLKLDNQTGFLTITNITTEHAGMYKLGFENDGPSSKASRVSVYVVNVSDVTLSWYKGNSLLSSISVSDLSISLSLPLEVEYQDKNTYSYSVHCCGSTEAVIRLVLSALVGVATVILLVYDIRSRRAE